MSHLEKSRDDRSSAEKLIDAAEILFGQHGVAGVSLRQIGAAAGSSNNYAVQYHFGDAAGLIQAILVKRTAETESKQAAMLQRLQDGSRLSDTRSLLDILLRPILDPLDRIGERSYARLIVALLNSPAGVVHFKNLMALTPMTDRVVKLLQTANPHIPHALLSERLRVTAVMVLSSVFNRLPPFDRSDKDGCLIDDVLDMATAGLTASVGESIRIPRARPT